MHGTIPKTKSFSQQFNAAINETRMLDALVKADGWTLADFVNAPVWLRELYTRHAVAACAEIAK